MKIIYSSILGGVEIENQKLISKPFPNENEFLDVLNDYCKERKKLVFISNREENKIKKPKEKDEVFNDYFYSNKKYFKALKKNFKLSSLDFEKYVLVDENYKGNLKEEIATASLVYVQGGHTLRGLDFINKIKLKECLVGYKKLLFLHSTATKILGGKKSVLSTLHGDIKNYKLDDGLGLKNYTIRPHFNFEVLKGEDVKNKNRLKLIKKLSKNILVFGVSGESFIVDDDGMMEYFGECYSIFIEDIKKI